jgi:hypothetical protein
MHYFLRLMRELHPGDARPAVDIATRWIRQPIEQVTQEVADGWLDTDLLGPTPWLVASYKSVTNQQRSQQIKCLIKRIK